jgi:nucleotide-binding universal stress UspA family protein
VKTLICVDGHAHALEATKLAAKFACAANIQVTFLFVRRYGKDARGYNIRRKATEVFADWGEKLPEMRCLHEAEEVFKQTRGDTEREVQMEEPRRALVHVGGGVFEEGRVYLRSNSQAHLKVREGIPHEEITREAEEGGYELVMLGARGAPGCRWYEVENIPLKVAQEAPCPVTVICKEFEEGQSVLVYVGRKDPPESTLHLGRVIAESMKSEIEVLAVPRTVDQAFAFSERVSSMMDTWSKSSLKVTPKTLTGKPTKVILEMAPNYGLIVCPSGEKRGKKRFGKVTKKLLCRQVNLLVAR